MNEAVINCVRSRLPGVDGEVLHLLGRPILWRLEGDPCTAISSLFTKLWLQEV